MLTYNSLAWRYWVIVLILVLGAAWLRVYKIGDVPHGMTWDEAAIGYNGFAIVHARRDEWLQFLPISFRSFGDYKAPLAIYVSGVFTTILGLELWVIRLPFVLSGVMAVLGFVLLLKELLPVEDKYSPMLTIMGGFLVMVSPWHLHFSRIGFESGMALNFVIWGMWCIFKYLKIINQLRWYHDVWLLKAIVFFVAAIYTYHSSKMVVPLLLMLMLVKYRKIWRKMIPKLIALALVAAGLLTPFMYDVFKGEGSTRFTQASIFGLVLSPSQILLTLISNTWAHLTPAFLLFGQTTTLRHGDGHWGILFPSTLGLIIVGITVVCYLKIKRQKVESTNVSLLTLGGCWAIAGFLPAVIGRDVPHANRALLALPGLLLLAVLGFRVLWKMIDDSKLNQHLHDTYGRKGFLAKFLIGFFFLVESLFVLSYVHDYYTVFAQESAADFKDGYIEAFNYILPYERGSDGKPEVDKVIVSDRYGQPYIYALLTRRTSPIMYQSGSLIKYEFKSVDIGDLQRKSAIVVASAEDELPLERADHVIYGSDHQVRFKIYVLP